MILIAIKLILSLAIAVWTIGVAVFLVEFFKAKGERHLTDPSPEKQRQAYTFIIFWPVFTAIIIWRRYKSKNIAEVFNDK